MNADSSPRLHRKTRPAAAFAALGETGLRRIEDCIVNLLQRDEVEDVHALRVGARYLRAVLWVFGPLVPPGITQRWKQDLRTLADMAGEVRDWDVFLAETVQPALERQPGDSILHAVADTARTRRRLAREIMVTRLAQYRDDPLPALHRDLAHLPLHADDGTGCLGPFARTRVRKARKTLRQRSLAARHDGLLALHRLRIAGKRLRYAIEALAPVLPKQKTRRLRHKLVRRQGKLGGVVDESVARRLMSECLGVAPQEHDAGPVAA
ncbi:CHAD domain-containing protein [Cupriavidus sp. WKF15]|uniref:CHAD domain-containing protein n=1 Tax=Cupriavidus sp. WKF15 TaxID=3032282 RepID=UPI0023E2DE39|nr:CHAD domain-containing protein [Cupriavidus sp. WKF15]WER46010.1 CHAD domain-containing protein [Cupriavidus sp. WKF15]